MSTRTCTCNKDRICPMHSPPKRVPRHLAKAQAEESTLEVWVVDKARITASFEIVVGQVTEVGAPRWCDLDERGVLKPSEVVWTAKPCGVCGARLVGRVRTCGYDCVGRNS